MTILRTRQFENKNYRALFEETTGNTWHFTINSKSDFLELKYPELYDIAINNLCYGACDYCYISATKKGHNYKNIVKKAQQFFGSMTLNQRPFQVAIGGAGEPTLHPDFGKFVETMRNLDICPNYTTNGMHLNDGVLGVTKDFVGGVALTCHNHLDKAWRKGVDKLHFVKFLNLHIIPMSINDLDKFLVTYNEYKDRITTFVMLPYQPIGFGKPIKNLPEIYDYLFDVIMPQVDVKRIGWGAGFTDELKSRPKWGKQIDYFSERLFSKYLDMDNNMTLFESSYEWEKPLKEDLLLDFNHISRHLINKNRDLYIKLSKH